MSASVATRDAVAWEVLPGLTPYPEALARMEAHVDAMIAGEAGEKVLLVEHPPVLTGGTSAKRADLSQPDRFDVFETRRGGQYTYHGPGQRVIYPMLDLNGRGRDIRAYVRALEDWVKDALLTFGITGRTDPERVGVWVAQPQKPALPGGTPREDKIAAIGVRVRRWVAYHGISVNVEPDLSHYDAIVPCGISGHGVTSLVDLGVPVTMPEVDAVLQRSFETIFTSQ